MKHPTYEALRRLRLYGMARGLEDLELQPERSQLSFDDQLALLVERETAERANTALASRLKRARLRQTACLEDLDWRTPRGLDRTLVRDLASCPGGLGPPAGPLSGDLPLGARAPAAAGDRPDRHRQDFRRLRAGQSGRPGR